MTLPEAAQERDEAMKCLNCRKELVSKTDPLGTYWWHSEGGTVWCYTKDTDPPDRRHLRADPFTTERAKP